MAVIILYLEKRWRRPTTTYKQKVDEGEAQTRGRNSSPRECKLKPERVLKLKPDGEG
jgi:hypothetical protein